MGARVGAEGLSRWLGGPSRSSSSRVRPSVAGLMSTGPDGGPVKRNTFSKAWRRAATVAGAEGLRSHDPRHSSAAMTLYVYSHLWPDSDERSRAAIDAPFGAPADSARTGSASMQVRGRLHDCLDEA